MKPAAGETTYLERIETRIRELRNYLNALETPSSSTELGTWFETLQGIKTIQGNLSNDLSLVACLMVKKYLVARFDLPAFDVAEKAQGAPGLDIDLMTRSGERIIGEIKTTTPYKGTRFGAQQLASFKKDFAKLRTGQAEHKFMFVTDNASYQAIQEDFMTSLEGIELVCL